ncbi:MAG: ATP-dependent DNA ligase [Planctomycetes bacterium]|nr:ATP-dependent DNA ligase [Planctomycetota bacterium]
MQQRGTSAVRPPIVYFIFDVLHLGRTSLLDLTYLERRERLMDLKLADRHWQTPPHHLGNGKALLAVAKRQGLEGVLAKRATSRYRPGERSADWIKVKLTMREEFLVCGYLPGAGANAGSMGSLILGYHARGGRDGSHLVHAGNVGTGFTLQQRRAFKDVLDRTATARSPFRSATIPKIAVYAQPTLIAEVEFSEWTHDGSVRHPRFVGLRVDKPLDEVEDPRPRAAPAPAATIRPRGRSSKPTRRSHSER